MTRRGQETELGAADKNGRPYAVLATLKSGDFIEADGDFECINPGAKCVVLREARGMFVLCANGKHYLNAEPNGVVVGFYTV